MYLKLYVSVYMFANNLGTAATIATEFSGLLQGASVMLLGAKKVCRVMGREPENWHFSYTAAPAGEAWAALGSHSLQPLAATATGRPRHWRRDTLSYTAVRVG